jgi:hypothetical protein
MGLQLVGTIASDGSNVGQNPSSLVSPGASATYTYIAQREGSHLVYSTAATTGGEGDGGSLAMGLFGSVNVEQKGAEWYRSQLTADEMALATAKNADGTPKMTAGGQPILDYDAVFPAGHPRAGQPILKMLDANNNIVHSDLNAVITAPNKGRFPAGTYKPNAVEPYRDAPFREVTVADFPCRDQQMLFKRRIEWIRRCQRSLEECAEPRCMHAIGVEPVLAALKELDVH